MRPRDTEFIGQDRLPVWAATLHRELGGGGDEAPAGVLTPLAALDEIVATATSLIGGRGDIPEADRLSLSLSLWRDVSASLKNLGRSAQKQIAAVLRPFQSTDLAPSHVS